MTSLSPTERPVTLIKPPSGFSLAGLSELWRYRELVGFLAWRDISVRYKQTLLGVAWAVLQPLVTMIVFSVIFGHFAKIPSEDVPYPVFSFAGLLPWQFFSYTINQAGTTLVMNQNLITKIYFPRLCIPLASVTAGLLDFCIAFLILGGLMIGYGVGPGLAILALPLFIALMVATALGLGLWLSSLSVEYRDVQYVVPFLVQFLLLVTPIAYPPSLLPEGSRFILGFNPMAGVVEGFRWCLLGSDVDGPLIATSVGVALVLLASGVWYFRRVEDYFADRI
jgi:lipopolysaccharide transport system permease protein